MKTVRLLLEGKHDKKLILAILQKTRPELEGHFSIEECGGIDPLLDALELQVLGSDSVLGIVCDADEDCRSQWARVRTACESGGLRLDDEAIPSTGYLLNETGQRKFGCWIMPDNQSSGALEAYLMEGMTSPSQGSLREQAQKFVESAEPRLFPNTEAATQKATLRAWFAVQEEPIWLPSFAVGQALLLPEISPEDPFVKWLAALVAMLD